MALDSKVTLHNLATDCLRLTMHFFLPIQLSAEQIYHTALPLSPTSSCLQNSYLQSATDDQLSYVTAFIGAPSTWGLLLRTISTRPRKLTCIATSGQKIIAACEGIVNIYDAVTGVLQQSLSTSKIVTKIQASPDGSTLYFLNTSSLIQRGMMQIPSITMWDVQTGGLIHTFAIQSGANDIAVSTSGDFIACGSYDGSVRFWNTHTKKEGRGFGGGQPVVAICWLPPQKLMVATQNSLYIHVVTTGEILNIITIPDQVWGMIYSGDKDEFLVGTSKPWKDQAKGFPIVPLGLWEDQEEDQGCQYSFRAVSNQCPEPLGRGLPKVHKGRPVRRKMCQEKQSLAHPRELVRPTLVGKDIACITVPMGVQLFNTGSYDWTNNPPLLNTATSVAVLLNRNLVAQTKDTIQIFSTDVLTSGEALNDTRVSHVYPLDKNHIICLLQPTRDLAVLELETLRELHRGDETLPFKLFVVPSLLLVEPMMPYIYYLSRTAHVWRVVDSWLSGTSLSRDIEIPDDNRPLLLYGLSPTGTRIASIFRYGCSPLVIWVKDTKNGDELAMLPLEGGDLESEEVYDITFDSETRFYLKIDGPGRHVQVPCDITPSEWDPDRGPMVEKVEKGLDHRYKVTKGEPMPLSEPRAPPQYTLDANCEWVLDVQSRKICWISPRNLRRGRGGHFWAGPSLVMVGDDGVVRKVSFREPDC